MPNISIKNLILKFNYKLSLFFLKSLRQRIVFCREDRIGHQAGGLDVEITKAIRIKKRIKINSIFIFFEKESEIANLYLRKFFIKKINDLKFKTLIINENFFGYNFFYKFINYLLFKINKSKRIKLASIDIGKRIKSPLIKKSYNHKSICKKLNIKNNRYICIYSRDDNYLKIKYEKTDCSYHQYRNSNIDNFRKLSEYILEKYNWSVIRIGSQPKRKIDWETKGESKIVDYPFSGFRTAQNDIDLIAGCNLYFSNGGGPESVAIASRRNIIKINQIPIGDEHLNNFGLWTPKIHQLKGKSNYLSLVEICKLNLHKCYFSKEYDDKEIILHENKPEEILQIFLDYVKFKNKSFSKEERSIINRYHSVRKFIFKEWGALINSKNFIAPSFLMKYENLLDL